MAGRRPKPTQAKILAGNPGKRPLNQNEAQPRREIPNCPRHLDEEGRREWNRMVKDLYDAGLFSAVDRAALAAYCSAYSRWVRAEAELKNADWVELTDKGYAYQTPWLSILNKALDQMKSFLVEFGMTPASRSRINVEKPEEPDELERLLFGEKVKVKDG